MFITYDEHKVRLPPLWGNSSTHWKAAELALQRVWFVVSLAQSDESNDGYPITHTMLIFNMVDLEALAPEEAVSGFQLDSVLIVTPGYVNGTGQWKMETLKALWSAKEPRDPAQVVEIYETGEGVLYTDSMRNTPAQRLHDKKLLRSFPVD